jgi:hypothetical protein
MYIYTHTHTHTRHQSPRHRQGHRVHAPRGHPVRAPRGAGFGRPQPSAAQAREPDGKYTTLPRSAQRALDGRERCRARSHVATHARVCACARRAAWRAGLPGRDSSAPRSQAPPTAAYVHTSYMYGEQDCQSETLQLRAKGAPNSCIYMY